MADVRPVARQRTRTQEQRLKRPPASNEVLRILRRLIERGELLPGQRLPNERLLAEQLGVSRPTLREGVRALEAMNILVVRQGAGTYVSSLDAELLAEPLQLVISVNASAIHALFEARRITEPPAAGLAAKRAGEDELNLLREEMARGRQDQADAAALVAHDTRIHNIIHHAAHNPILLSTSASLAGLAHKSRVRSVNLPENAKMTVQEHQAIVDAICARDSRAASLAMTVHLIRVETQMREEDSAAIEIEDLHQPWADATTIQRSNRKE